MAGKGFETGSRDIIDEMQAQIEDLQSAVTRLQNIKQPTNPVYQRFSAPNPGDLPDDPIEGQVALGADDNKLHWYVNGAWRTAGETPTAIDGFSSDSVVSDAAFHDQDFDSSVFITNDSTRYTVGTVSGRSGLIIHKVGTYIGWFSIHMHGPSGLENLTVQADAGGGFTPFGGTLGAHLGRGIIDTTSGGTSWYVAWGYPFAVDSANVAANNPICIQAQQQTGGTLATEPTFFVQWVSDDTFGY